MKKLHYDATIAAPRALVWDTMLAPDTYQQWTAEFMPGSYYEGSWDEGSRIRFLAPDGTGMISVIATNRPHEFVSIKHLGEIKNGVEDTESDAVRAWAPAFENYTLSDAGSGTRVDVDMDVAGGEFEEFMAQTWPRALARLKALCESRSKQA